TGSRLCWPSRRGSRASSQTNSQIGSRTSSSRVERHGCSNDQLGGGGPLDLQASTEGLHPVAHVSEAKPVGLRSSVTPRLRDCIADLNSAVAGNHPHRDPGGGAVSVPEGIVEGFLNDAVAADLYRHHRRRPTGVEIAPNL